MRAAEEMSSGVLASGNPFDGSLWCDPLSAIIDAEIVRPNHDLSAQLTARKERLSWLIMFINDNGALRKASHWHHHRKLLSHETFRSVDVSKESPALGYRC